MVYLLHQVLGRGIEGKIDTVRYAKKITFRFGICLGMQMAVIEYSRNVLGYADANSTEMNENTAHPVINLMEEQKLKIKEELCVWAHGNVA